MNYLVGLSCILFTLNIIQNSVLENRVVTIAVVEYQPILNKTLSKDDRILANTEEYIKLLNSIDEIDLDLIIFPEDTLRNNPETAVETTIGEIPCNSSNYPKFMQKLSCATINSTTYLVINLVEKIKCSATNHGHNCKRYGFVFYNTDIILDRLGRIVAKYHKYNLFGEYELDKPPMPEIVTFTTDFGVKFGIFTCFDILFKSPAQDLLGEKPDALIFPSMWFSQLPFLTALQTQQMWAHAHDVRFFAAGANNPQVGSGGSGVYAGSSGASLFGIVARGGSRVYVYKFVKGESPGYNPQRPEPFQDPDVLGREMDNFHITADPSVSKYNSTILDTSLDDFNGDLCYNGRPKNQLCCNFNIKITRNGSFSAINSYTYRLVAFSGVRSFSGVYNGGIEICGVIACLNSSISSCGLRFANYEKIDWPITFEEIKIVANFEKSVNKTQFPNSLLGSIRPINASQTIWEKKEMIVDGKTVVERIFAIKEPQNRLLTFAIYGRNFGQDSPPENDDNGSVKSMGITWMLLFVTIILSFYVTK